MAQQCVVSSGSEFLLADLQAFRTTAHILVGNARRVSPALAKSPLLDQLQAMADGEELATKRVQHEAICAFLDCLKLVSRLGISDADNYTFVAKCSEYDRYIDKLAKHYRANARDRWRAKSIKSKDNPALAGAVDEIVRHVQGFSTSASPYESRLAYTQMRTGDLFPAEIAGLRQEANFGLVFPFFEKSLSIPGDAAKFGCFRGILSVKLAWIMKAVGANRHYYAFDTFRGFEINDPSGGPLGIGNFSDNLDAYTYLTLWSRILPLTPIKGDATRTCSVLEKPLSFVWLDLDMSVLMDPVLRKIWHLCSPDTIIGIDDVGRPETPTVGPWLDRLIEAGALELVFNSDDAAPNTCIRFLKKKGPFPSGPLDKLRSVLPSWR